MIKYLVGNRELPIFVSQNDKVMKHQSNCYRNIGGHKLVNYCDLCMTDEINEQRVKEAKELYGIVRKVKHHSGGYHQLFVGQPKEKNI